MSTLKLAVAACGLLACSGASAEDTAMAPVHQFIDSLNAGDIKSAAAAHLPRSPIIDEFAPYHWNNFGAWLKSFQAVNKKYNMTDTRVVLSAPTTNLIDGEYAYEVVPNVTYGKAGGKPFADKGIFTFTLIKTAKGWRIASWAFAEQ